MSEGGRYGSGRYWEERNDLIYYHYVDHVLRRTGAEARSLIDVGTGNCPYLEWWGWIPERVSVDIRVPYRSPRVRGLRGDIHALDLPRFDVCTCLQVLEHVPDAARFARRLLDLADLVIVSVPYLWPEGRTTGHLHDPVDEASLAGWFGRAPNWQIVVQEPFEAAKARRLIALYDRDPARGFGPARMAELPRQPPAPRAWPGGGDGGDGGGEPA